MRDYGKIIKESVKVNWIYNLGYEITPSGDIHQGVWDQNGLV